MSEKEKGQGGKFSYIIDQLQHLAVPIDTLHHDAPNARKHNDKNMDAIKASLHRFGQRSPIVVQKSNMVVRAGNGRLMAAKDLGWSHIAAVIVDDSSVDAVSFAIADNRTAELAEWDKETLASLLDTMDEEDLKVTGFDNKDLQTLLADLTPDFHPVGLEKQGRLDQKQPKICPQCGHQWHE
jgi:ParB-like chromosome segregation protein Spo0J